MNKEKGRLIYNELELARLVELLELFEHQTDAANALDQFSGGFAAADLDDVEDDTCYITLKWGIQDGDEDTVHTEQWTLPCTALRGDKWDVKKAIQQLED